MVYMAVVGLCGVLLWAPKASDLAPEDEQLLDQVERRAFDFFWNEADPSTGLIRDQANNFEADTNEFRIYRAGIASVGFGLSAYCVGVERGWITADEARARVANILHTFDKLLESDDNGLYPPWVDMRTNRRWAMNERDDSASSPLHTALFLAGAITAGEYFDAKFGDRELKQTVDHIYRRIKWNAFAERLASSYDERILVSLLGIGCPENALSPEVWREMRRHYQFTTANRKDEADYPRIFQPSLIAHLLPQAWFDFRHCHDAYANYFLSSRNSVLSNRRYCIDHAPGGIADRRCQFATYSSNVWGLSACVAPPPKGFRAYGEADPALDDSSGPGTRGIDGTVAIYAAAGSMPFAPEEALAMLRHLYRRHKDDLWGRYGFCDSFNMDSRVRAHFNSPSKAMWRSEIVSGMDQGLTLLMIENYRRGGVWRWFMRNEHIRKAMDLAGFVAQSEPPEEARLDLAGDWWFRTGDDVSWSTSDAGEGWSKIEVPGRGEGRSPDGDAGRAWYRRGFLLPSRSPLKMAGPLLLRIGAVDDVDEIFLNGQRIDGTGGRVPDSVAFAGWLCRVPEGALLYGQTNIVAMRVREHAKGGGIRRGPVDLVPLSAVQYRPFDIVIPGE